VQSPAHGLALPHSTPRQGLPNQMTTHIAASAAGRPAPADPDLLLLVAAAAVLEALAQLLRPLLAHAIALALTTAGWSLARSAAPAPEPAPSPAPAQRSAAALTDLPVRELRQPARSAPAAPDVAPTAAALRKDRQRVHCPGLARWAASADAEPPLWWAV